MKTKLIKVSEHNHQKLSDLGSKGESFNDVVSMLIESYEKKLMGE